jgi:hypothetical protein
MRLFAFALFNSQPSPHRNLMSQLARSKLLASLPKWSGTYFLSGLTPGGSPTPGRPLGLSALVLYELSLQRNNLLTFPHGLAIFDMAGSTSEGFQPHLLAFPIRSHSLVNQ